MINLQIEDYCGNCLKFDPAVTRMTCLSGENTTIITCYDREKCDELCKYLMTEKEKNK